MRPDGWHLTEDLDEFLARSGEFLRTRPARHTVALTVTETLRVRGMHAYGAEAPVFGRLEQAGEVRAAVFRTPPQNLGLTSLDPEDADTLAARLAGLGHRLPGVDADHDTATAFAEAWQRHTGATPTLRRRHRLYRLGELTPAQPLPAGRARIAGTQDREQLMHWYDEFIASVGNVGSMDAGSWADARIARAGVTFWETPDGTPVSMAGATPLVAGQIRVTAVYTPARLRGRGYAGAVTVEVSRAALAAGAEEVVLFADLANPTSNSLYRRVGYLPVADFAVYEFSETSAEDAPGRSR
ncbi:GNAT family N-acetyltransferase [Streptomyces adustus]|uniref:GNAT family N-acetyltransferase n=1 Tax=Streptomyces adustus TaxID=1609272 RepID=UPI00371D2611